MNHTSRRIAWLLIIFALVAGAGAVTELPARGDESPAQREAELLKEFRRSQDAETLLYLALLREERGKLQEAISTWALAKRLWGQKPRPRHSDAPTQSWAVTADFFTRRLQRKINLRSRPPQLPQQLYSRLETALATFRGEPPVDQLDLAVQADLDGDRVDELFYVGRHGPLGKRTRKSMGIAKWDGKAYRVVWRTQQNIPFMIHITDRDGDGWKEIFCGYEPDTDNAATLYFNGAAALFL